MAVKLGSSQRVLADDAHPSHGAPKVPDNALLPGDFRCSHRGFHIIAFLGHDGMVFSYSDQNGRLGYGRGGPQAAMNLIHKRHLS